MNLLKCRCFINDKPKRKNGRHIYVANTRSKTRPKLSFISISGEDPAKQVTGFKLEILLDYALLQPRAQPLLQHFVVTFYDG